MKYEQLVETLSTLSRTVATAESCTGGLIAKYITDIPGSSSVFIGGVVSYSNFLKMKLLDVGSKTLEESGAVSEDTVTEMVHGILKLTEANYAIAVSGIAGPGGGSKEKPVGTVFIGTGCKDIVDVKEYHFKGSRKHIREKSAQVAVGQLLELITKME